MLSWPTSGCDYSGSGSGQTTSLGSMSGMNEWISPVQWQAVHSYFKRQGLRTRFHLLEFHFPRAENVKEKTSLSPPRNYKIKHATQAHISGTELNRVCMNFELQRWYFYSMWQKFDYRLLIDFPFWVPLRYWWGLHGIDGWLLVGLLHCCNRYYCFDDNSNFWLPLLGVVA